MKRKKGDSHRNDKQKKKTEEKDITSIQPKNSYI